MTGPPPPSTLHAAIAAARADERAQCIAFLRREADRRAEVTGPEAEMFAQDSASFLTAAGLLAVCAAVWAAGPPGVEGADIEAEIRADERQRCVAVLRDQVAVLRTRGEWAAAKTASDLANLIDPQGPLMGARAAGGIS